LKSHQQLADDVSLVMIGVVKKKLFTIKNDILYEWTHRVLIFNLELKVKMEVHWGWCFQV